MSVRLLPGSHMPSIFASFVAVVRRRTTSNQATARHRLAHLPNGVGDVFWYLLRSLARLRVVVCSSAASRPHQPRPGSWQIYSSPLHQQMSKTSIYGGVGLV